MTKREHIRQMTAEMLARQEAHSAEIARLQEVTRAQLRKVASTLPEVPPMLKEFLDGSDASAPSARSDNTVDRGDPREAATAPS
jgi:hypothetical protein